jgi:hypothetical protein
MSGYRISYTVKALELEPYFGPTTDLAAVAREYAARVERLLREDYSDAVIEVTVEPRLLGGQTVRVDVWDAEAAVREDAIETHVTETANQILEDMSLAAAR